MTNLRTKVEALERWATDRKMPANIRPDPHGDLLSYHDVMRLLDELERSAVEPKPQPRQTRYCDYDMCPAIFDPAHSNNDH